MCSFSIQSFIAIFLFIVLNCCVPWYSELTWCFTWYSYFPIFGVPWYSEFNLLFHLVFIVSNCNVTWYSQFHRAVPSGVLNFTFCVFSGIQTVNMLCLLVFIILLFPLVSRLSPCYTLPLLFRVSPCCIRCYSEFHPAVSNGFQSFALLYPLQSFTFLYPLVFRVLPCCIHWYSELPCCIQCYLEFHPAVSTCIQFSPCYAHWYSEFPFALPTGI
jgi:hypothetical protein